MAAVGGVAYVGAKAGSNRSAAQQQQQAAGPAPAAEPVAEPAAAPAAPASVSGGASDRIAQLQQLASLHTSGALTDEEFATEKARVLA
jgi:hypothetical protein